jgi:uncharacterized membrane protein YqiK
LSFVVVIFAIGTQLLAAAGAISLSTTQQLTMWLVALGLIVLLSIAYMACHAYLTAKTNPPVLIDRDDHRNLRRNGDGRVDKADPARTALAAAEEQWERARAQADKAEQEAKDARAQADRAEREATYARVQADRVKREIDARLDEGMAPKTADAT